MVTLILAAAAIVCAQVALWRWLTGRQLPSLEAWAPGEIVPLPPPSITYLPPPSTPSEYNTARAFFGVHTFGTDLRELR